MENYFNRIEGMMEEWVNMKIEDLVLKTKLKDPNKHPDTTFKYIDVSGVSNTLFKIDHYAILFGKEAPSRARKLINFKDIIFATVRPTLMRIALVPQELDGEVCSTGYCVLKPNQEKIFPQFLYYSVLTDLFIEKISKLQKGASYPAIRDSDLKNQIINLPPLSEQRKIAQVLSTVQKAIEHQDNLIRTTTELKKALMQKLFTEGTRGEPQKETEIGLVPESWDVMEFPKFTLLQRGKDLIKTDFKDGKIPVAGSNGIIGFHNQSFVKAPGVTVGRSGSCGSVSFYEVDFWAHNTSLYVKDFNGNHEKFTFYYLKFLDLGRFKTGASVPTLDRNSLNTYQIGVPKKSEQIEISNILTTLDLMIETHIKKKQTLTALFKTLLHELMTGQRRVHEVEFEVLQSKTL